MCRKAGSLSRPPQIAVFPTASRKNWTYAYLSGNRNSHSGLFFHHHRRSAAERHERRHLGCVRRPREPDCIRSSWCGKCPVEGYDLVGRGVHAHIDHAIRLCHQARRPKFRPAGSEVPTGKDAARADSGTDDASHPEIGRREISSAKFPWLLPGKLSDRRNPVRQCPRRILA